MKNWFMHNLALKATALVLAFFTWLYVNEEIKKPEPSRPLTRHSGRPIK